MVLKKIGDDELDVREDATTTAREVVVPSAGANRIEKDVPFEIGALIDCGALTGVGAVLNTAQVEPGSTVVVVGRGGVGSSVIQDARLAGAAQIVAVEPVTENQNHAVEKKLAPRTPPPRTT